MDIELTDLVWDEDRGGYWLRPASERKTAGRCQSPAELAFWGAACDVLPGIVRQYHVAGTHYHLDFAVPAALLAIEIDGYAWHSSRKQRQHDSKRDRILTSLGWRVLRFTASEVLRNADRCAKEALFILKKCTNP